MAGRGNPNHDRLGRFTSPGAVPYLLDMVDAMQEKDLGRLMYARSQYEQHEKKNALDPNKAVNERPALFNKEEVIAERDRLIAEGTKEELEAFVNARTTDLNYLELIRERDYKHDLYILRADEYKFLNERYFNGELEDETGNDDYEYVRERGIEALHAFEDFKALQLQAEEYKDITAPAVARMAELIIEEQKANGTYREYTEDHLNNLELIGEFESGSREWLESRQNGIGGSDVGNILKLDPDYKEKNFEEMLASKIEPISDEEVEQQAQNHATFTTPTGRGNAWEPVILEKFNQNHPDLNITHCKTSWRSKENPFQYANFDGLMVDENGKPNGIVEIKTASDPTKWGDPSLGLDGVPPHYRAQALWYCQAAGFKKGAIAVMIDDKEYREYHFEIDAVLEREQESNLEAVKQFVETLPARRAGTYVEPEKEPYIKQGFPKTLVTTLDRSLRHGRSLPKGTLKQIAAYREESEEEVEERLKNKILDRVPFFSPKEPLDEDSIRSALREMYTEFDPSKRKRPLIGVDIETSGVAPTRGRIIEIGITKRETNGKQKDSSKLYGIPKRAFAIGTGNEMIAGVHKITPTMIAKKRTFNNEKEQQEMLETLKSGTMVAHNAIYERGWFRLHLKGFAEAEKRGEIKILDSLMLSRHLILDDVPNNKLQSFSKRYGIDYDGRNAHRAGEDTNMMIEAVNWFQEELAGRHTPEPIK